MSETDSANGSDRPSGERDISVLLVDDDEAWVRSTARVLEHQRDGMAVLTATDLATASTVFAEEDPDCVVCDYELGAGTGLDLLAEIRERADDRPFILVTGEGDESVASEAIGRRVTDYFPKRSIGGRTDLLARRVEAAVESHRTRRALDRERRSKEAMLEILTAAGSRDGLLREFCEHLVGEHGYACAWIGTADGSGSVVPRAAAGEESYLDAALDPETPPEAGTEPALRALASREPHVVAPLAEGPDPSGDGWRAAAAARGFESAAAVPIDHDGNTFGALAVYATAPVVGRQETELLAEYGRTIGYALRSAERKESLMAAAPTAIEIEIADERAPLVAVAGRLPTGATVDVLTTVPRRETILYALRIAGASASQVREAAGAVEAVERVRITRDDEPRRCELVVGLPTPESVLAEHGGRVLDVAVEHGRLVLTAASGDGGSVGSLVDALRSRYPDAGVRSVRSSGATPGRDVPDDPFGSLTDKQRRAVELAFYYGYFEDPREHNKTEVAEKFGVSRQTFSQHLRAGERKLLAELLERADGEPPD